MTPEKQWIDAAYAQLEPLAESPRIAIFRAVEAGTERVYLERTMDDGSVRYVRVNWVGNLAEGVALECYTLLGGQYQTPARARDFDGRTYGALPAIVDFVKKWIVDIVDDSQWAELAMAVPVSIGISRPLLT